MSLSIESADVVQLIQQFLKENGLKRSLEALQEETGIHLNAVEDRSALQRNVLRGRWELVIPALAQLHLSQELVTDIYEQMVRELAELQEKDAARTILQQTPCLAALERLQPQRHRRLLQACQRPYFNIADAYGDDYTAVAAREPLQPGQGAAAGPDAGSALAVKDRVRERIARAVEREVREVPVSRLLVLLNQALKWEVHTGQLSLDAVAESVAAGLPGYDLLQGKVIGVGGGPAEDQAAAQGEEELHPANLVHKIKFKKSQCEAATFSPNGQFLLSGDSEGFLEVYDSGTGKLSKKLKYQAEDDMMMHDAAISAVVFSNDGEYIASGDVEGTIKIWRLMTGSCLAKFPKAHAATISSIQFSRDGTQFLSCSRDSLVRIYGLKSRRLLREFNGHESFANQAVYSKDGKFVLSCSSDGSVKLWDSRTAECLRTFTLHQGDGLPPALTSLHLVPGAEDRFIVASQSSNFYLVNIQGQLLQTYKAQGPVPVVAVSRRGGAMFAVGDDAVLYCFQAATGRLEHAIKLHSHPVNGFVCHPHRNIFASFSQDGTIRLWKS